MALHPPTVLATWDIRSGNWYIACDRTNLLAEAWEMRVQSTRFMLLATRLPTRLFHEGEVQFVLCIFISMKQQVCFRFNAFQERVLRWIKPPATSLLLGTLSDLTRKKSELIAENALLRQQLIILRRQVKRPVCGKTDRFLLVLLVRVVRSWKQALFLVQPETLLRWHRELFGMFTEAQIQGAHEKAETRA